MGVYDDRLKVFVEPFQGTPVKYGFASNVDANVATACGHQAIADDTAGLVFGANSPKPGRASRKRATGQSEGSFYDWAVYAALLADGWSASLPKRRRGGASARGQSVYVTINGIKYAWNMTNRQATRIGGLDALGISVATANDTDLVFGANSPKPPVARKVEVGQDGTDVISTFVDPQRLNDLPAGWALFNESVQIT